MPSGQGPCPEFTLMWPAVPAFTNLLFHSTARDFAVKRHTGIVFACDEQGRDRHSACWCGSEAAKLARTTLSLDVSGRHQKRACYFLPDSFAHQTGPVRERHTSETMRNIPALSPRSRSFVIRCPAGTHNAEGSTKPLL